MTKYKRLELLKYSTLFSCGIFFLVEEFNVPKDLSEHWAFQSVLHGPLRNVQDLLKPSLKDSLPTILYFP